MGQNLSHLFAFSITSKLNGEDLLNESMRGLLHHLKISLVHKRVKRDRSFSLTLRKFSVLLRCQELHTANGTQPNSANREGVNGADVSRIRWRRIVNVNATIEIGPLVSWNRKTF